MADFAEFIQMDGDRIGLRRYGMIIKWNKRLAVPLTAFDHGLGIPFGILKMFSHLFAIDRWVTLEHFLEPKVVKSGFHLDRHAGVDHGAGLLSVILVPRFDKNRSKPTMLRPNKPIGNVT